jgi:hypothetical protein
VRGARHVDEDLGVLLLLKRGRVVEPGVDIRHGAELQRHLDETVDLDVVALGLEVVDDDVGRPGVGNAAAVPARPRAAAPSASDASGVMTKFS